MPVEEFGHIWARIKDLVVKSILSGLSEMREEFKKGNETRFGLKLHMSHYYDKILSLKRYNCYKLLGYDIMLDSTFRPHLLEVNSRPSVYQE